MKGPKDKNQKKNKPATNGCNFRLKEDPEMQELLDSEDTRSYEGHEGEDARSYEGYEGEDARSYEGHEGEDARSYEGHEGEDDFYYRHNPVDPNKNMAAEGQAAYGIYSKHYLEELANEECACGEDEGKSRRSRPYPGPFLKKNHEIPEVFGEDEVQQERDRERRDDDSRKGRKKHASSPDDSRKGSKKHASSPDDVGWNGAAGESADSSEGDSGDRRISSQQNLEERYVQSLEDYDSFLDSKEAKYEYHRGYIYEMAGGSPEHAAIIANLMGEVRERLRRTNRRCRAYSSDLMVHVEEDESVFLPDVSAICGAPETSSTLPNAITNPIFLAEVLSPSTQDRDFNAKFESYKLLPTFREYLLVSQETYLVYLFQKNSYGEWSRTRYRRIDQEIRLQSLGITIPMELIYEDIEDLSDHFVKPQK
jgi:Uma2 family endonuclease